MTFLRPTKKYGDIPGLTQQGKEYKGTIGHGSNT